MYQYRMAKADDLKRIVEIEMRSKMESNPSCREKHQTDFDTRHRWWIDYFNRTSHIEKVSMHRVIFVAMIKLNIVGFIAGHLTSHPDPQGEIQSMHVLKPQWGKGAGVNLLRNLARWFKKQGVASVYVHVAEHSPYKEFYAQHGATPLNDSLYGWDNIGEVTEES